MTNVDLSGLGVALITPFNSDGHIDWGSLAGLIEHLVQNDVDYIVALGTTAETPTLSEKEKAEVVRFIVEKVEGRIPVVKGVGGNCTAEVAEEMHTSDISGISAFLSVVPYYNKPTQEGLYQHYCFLSKKSPLPIILYNVPGRTGVNMSVDTTLRIARDCTNVIAIKEASGDLNQIKALIKDAPKRFQVISGDDAMAVPLIEHGGVGVISVLGNVFPREMAWLVRHTLRGDARNTRRKMEEKFKHLFQLMFVEGNPAGIKCMLACRGMVENILRLPLVQVSEKTQQLICAELQKIGS